MTEKIRPLRDPLVAQDGSLVVHSVATPEAYDTRGAATVGSHKVIPVIFVPGIMGTNLRMRSDAPLPEHHPLAAGAAAWRPPNSSVGGLREANKWGRRPPDQRQTILHPDMLEVDDTGELDSSGCSLEHKVMRERGWGEIHGDSYGMLLYELQSHLDMTFRLNALKQREVRDHWKCVMQCDPWKQWGVRDVQPITVAELEKYAAYQYPLYAVGYNWLQSCALSAQRLERRIGEIIAWWQARRHECEKVILVTHSMGGLVARACAKRIPGRIAGIIHGVMPALGAPVVYRRIACGAESCAASGMSISSLYEKYRAQKIAEIIGQTTDETTPVMAASPGALELLPNQLYPRPWMHIRVMRRPYGERETAYDYLHLPSSENPYNFYRDTQSWYRLINPALADPAGLYQNRSGGARKIIGDAIGAAEKFHTELADYYHEHSYAFFGNDKEHLSFGKIRWTAQEPAAANVALSWSNVRAARFVEHTEDGARVVEVEGSYRLRFQPEPQDAPGDDTVPAQSGAGPAGEVAQVFPTRGYCHQNSFEDSNMVLLTRHLIVKIVQGL